MKEKCNKIIDKMAQFGYEHYKLCENSGAALATVGLFLYGLGFGMHGFRRANEHWSKAAQDVLNKIEDK